jgi:predicted transcriptional regulator
MIADLKILIRSERFRISRQEANISQARVEQKTGIAASLISQWERGRHKLTDHEIELLWSALGQLEPQRDRVCTPAPAPVRQWQPSSSSKWIPEFACSF